MPVPGAPPDGPVVPVPPVPVLGASSPPLRVVPEPVTDGEPVEPEGAATPDAPAARPAPASVPCRFPTEERELPCVSPLAALPPPSVMLVPVPGVPGLPGVPVVPDGPVPALPPPELPPEPPPAPPAPPAPCASAAPLASAVQASHAIIHVRAFIVVSLYWKHGSRKGRSSPARMLARTPLQGFPVCGGNSYLRPHRPVCAAAGSGISLRMAQPGRPACGLLMRDRSHLRSSGISGARDGRAGNDFQEVRPTGRPPADRRFWQHRAFRFAGAAAPSRHHAWADHRDLSGGQRSLGCAGLWHPRGDQGADRREPQASAAGPRRRR
ncbi:hypothetical protein CBM2633_A70060 [Cupriavidus taiwanensis]|nr:hypothetical protein CBM2633_A70060 [Cupriavidus taiwanensis]